MDKLLTVLVPAYNAELYLRNNLDSLLGAQNDNWLEVIVVDDGSTDKTSRIADDYAQRFPENIRVVHKENGGHGSGINCGIRLAQGKYFKVVDADDWVDKYAFTKLLDYLKKTDTDAVVSGFYWAFDNGSGNESEFQRRAEIREPFPGVIYEKTYSFDEVADQLYLKMHGLTIKTDILKNNDIRVDENCYYVDSQYILYPIPYIETISFIPDFVYQYRIGREGQSVSRSAMIRLNGDYDKVIRSLLQFYEACQNGKGHISDSKKRYIAEGISRVVSGKIKAVLNCPVSHEKRRELETLDILLKEGYPEIYRANRNRWVELLRKTGYILYPAAAWMCRKTGK